MVVSMAATASSSFPPGKWWYITPFGAPAAARMADSPAPCRPRCCSAWIIAPIRRSRVAVGGVVIRSLYRPVGPVTRGRLEDFLKNPGANSVALGKIDLWARPTRFEIANEPTLLRQPVHGCGAVRRGQVHPGQCPAGTGTDHQAVDFHHHAPTSSGRGTRPRVLLHVARGLR